MSVGTQTSLAHDRDQAIRAVVLGSGSYEARSTRDWFDMVRGEAERGNVALQYRCGIPQVGAVLRTLQDEGLVERKVHRHAVREHRVTFRRVPRR